MARAPRIGINVIYDLQEGKQQLKPIVQDLAQEFSITSGSAVTINGAEVQEVTLQGDNINYSYDSDTKKADISISGAETFSLNGETINSASITGAGVSIDNGNAIISISGGTSGNISVNGSVVNAISISGGALVNISDSVANVLIAGSSVQKNSPEFNLTASSTNAVINIPVTVTASALSDGLVNYWQNSAFDVEQLTAKTFAVTPQLTGTKNLGFYIGETANYYPAAKDLTFNVTTPLVLLCHFEDTASPFYNNGTMNLNITGTAQISAEYGKFGNGAKIVTMSIASTSNELYMGGQDFTLDFWQKHLTTTGYPFQIIFGNYQLRQRFYQNKYYLGMPSSSQGTTEDLWTPADFTTKLNHIAFVYQHDKQLMTFYYNGFKTFEHQNTTITREAVTNFAFGQNWLDELRYLDGVAYWTANFTPPTQPYTN